MLRSRSGGSICRGETQQVEARQGNNRMNSMLILALTTCHTQITDKKLKPFLPKSTIIRTTLSILLLGVITATPSRGREVRTPPHPALVTGGGKTNAILRSAEQNRLHACKVASRLSVKHRHFAHARARPPGQEVPPCRHLTCRGGHVARGGGSAEPGGGRSHRNGSRHNSVSTAVCLLMQLDENRTYIPM